MKHSLTHTPAQYTSIKMIIMLEYKNIIIIIMKIIKTIPYNILLYMSNAAMDLQELCLLLNALGWPGTSRWRSP